MDPDGEEFAWATDRPPRPPSTLPDRFRLWVDGDLFLVSRPDDRENTFDYTRLTGPDPGHGFSTGTGGRHFDMADHLEQCRWFLWIVDPVTGHIEDD